MALNEVASENKWFWLMVAFAFNRKYTMEFDKNNINGSITSIDDFHRHECRWIPFISVSFVFRWCGIFNFFVIVVFVFKIEISTFFIILLLAIKKPRQNIKKWKTAFIFFIRNTAHAFDLARDQSIRIARFVTVRNDSRFDDRPLNSIRRFFDENNGNNDGNSLLFFLFCFFFSFCRSPEMHHHQCKIIIASYVYANLQRIRYAIRNRTISSNGKTTGEQTKW